VGQSFGPAGRAYAWLRRIEKVKNLKSSLKRVKDSAATYRAFAAASTETLLSSRIVPVARCRPARAFR
jgi:hypothetical protein